MRYEWLEKIRKENQFQYIATAHHIDDSLETILYNFTKGTGIRGLKGIPLKNGFLIRPLLFTDKVSIEAFAEQQQISFRLDESNLSNKYTRNQIRHQIIPVLKNINPSLTQTTQQTIRQLKETEAIFQWAIDKITQQTTRQEKDQLIIQLDLLQQFPAVASLLYEIVSPYGFNSDQIQQILEPRKIESGQQFFSKKYFIVLFV